MEKDVCRHAQAKTAGDGHTRAPAAGICAGIVTYNPDEVRLRENIEAVLPQVEKIYIVDNASANRDGIKSLLRALPDARIDLISNAENTGIAHALNQLLAASAAGGYDWLLTLDQDSVVMDGLVAEYCGHLAEPRVGMLCCEIVDRNFAGTPPGQKSR